MFSIIPCPASWQDVFCRLYNDCFPAKNITPELIDRIFVVEPAMIFLAVQKDENNSQQSLGFVYFWTVVDEIQIMDIGVLPQFRRQGVGSKLMQRLMGLAAEKNQRITLEVRSGNKSAIHLYEKLGFANVGLRRAYYDDGEDAVLYAR